MITLVRPLLFSMINRRKTRKLLCDLLAFLARQTDNELDDQLVAQIRKAIL